MSDLEWPKLRIRVPDGRAVLTSVELDGKQLPATRVQFDTGDVDGGLVKVTVTFYADLDVEVEGVPMAVTGVASR